MDASSGLITFEAGELDWYIAPIANWDALSSNPNFKTEMGDSNHITYVAINYQANDKLENDYVRKAIAYAIDKEAMNIAGFDGHAAIATHMEHPSYNTAAPSGGIVYNYDPDKAKALLTEGGFPNGVDVGVILCFPGSHFEKCAQVLQANLAAVGITAKLELVEQATMLNMTRAQDFDIAVTGYASIGEYDAFRARVHSASKGAYYVKFEGDKFDYKRIDELFELSSAELDPTKRLALTQELNDMVMDTACLLPLLHKAQPYVWNKDLNVVNVPSYYEIYNWSWN